MRVVVTMAMVMVAVVNVFVGTHPTVAITRLVGFAHRERHQITLRPHGVRRAGSAALDLCNVASGRFDGFWEFNLNPWDTAAGVLIVEEAGGKVSRFDGSPFEIDSHETLGSNGLVHAALMHEFKEIFAGRGLEALPQPSDYQK